jgi:putative DNA primase/helicase
MNPALDQFRAALQRRVIVPPDQLVVGQMARANADGKRGKSDASYIFFDDGVPAGGFENHRDGLGWENWKADIGRKLSLAEAESQRERIAAAQRMREEADAARRVEAKARARTIWETTQPVPADHQYLARKRVPACGARLHNNCLVVPIRDSNGELSSLQFIDADGSKRFLTGGRVAGCYHAIGKPNGSICIAEGYATGASIYQATGRAVAVAFDCGNMEPVARELRAKYPGAQIVVCADDDARTEGNPGRTKANAAAQAVNGLVAIPEFGADRPQGATDFNDVGDANAIRRAIANAKPPGVWAAQPAAQGATAGDLSGPQVNLIRGDTVQLRPVDWLWDGYIALGKMHIVAGAPGTGKTTLALGLAATITQGGRWPDGSRASDGDVLIWSGEDAAGDTLAPRLRASGADLSRVHFVGDVQEGREPVPFDPSKHFAALALAASRLPRLRMMIVDPIVSAVAGDSHQNAEIRRALAPLVTFAESAGCALIGITHFTKGTQGREPLERVTGSLGFGAVARIVFGTAKLSEEDGGGRVLVRLKSNLGPDGGGFKYELRQTALDGEHTAIVATHVEWCGPIEGSAREILASAERHDETGGGESPRDFLRDLLSAGPMRAADVFKDADSNGYSKGQMHRAKSALGVLAEKLSMRGGWEWSLPKVPVGHEDTEGAGHKSLASSTPSAESAAYRARRGD